MYKHKPEYRRNLPHFQPDNDQYYFVTFRLEGSLPNEIIETLKAEHENALLKIYASPVNDLKKYVLIDQQHRRYFGKFDSFLDNNTTSPHWLKMPEIATILQESLHYRDNKSCELLCYCIMSNHCHLLIRLLNPDEALYGFMHSLKLFTAREANKKLNRSGAFWLHENYDRVVRNEPELLRIINYIANNPVKSGLASHWENWPYTFVNEDFRICIV